MASKQNVAGSRNSEEPVEVFRQFAWHLAGSLAGAPVQGGSARPAGKPAKSAGKRG